MFKNIAILSLISLAQAGCKEDRENLCEASQKADDDRYGPEICSEEGI